MMGRYVALAIVLLPACSSAAREPSNSTVAAIDSIINLTLTVAPAPGISVAVVRGGDTIVMKGYGLANVEDSVKVTDRTVFGIASVTKQFTAAAVMSLVESGILNLDDTIGEMWPSYHGPAELATLHQLLNHTAGIPNYLLNWDSFADRMPLTRDQMLDVLAQPLDFTPGTRFAYSPTGYYVLGVIIEMKSWPESYVGHLNRTQWTPLGLSTMGACSQEEIVPHRAQGYLTRRDGLYNSQPYALNATGSDGGLCSTARDLVVWARALAGGKVVSQGSYERMTTSGYGLRTGQLDENHPYIWHTGAYRRSSAVLVHYPEDNLTIAILANGGMMNLLPLQARIAREVLHLPVE